MTLEVLMATMHQSDTSLAQKSNCKSDMLIINQTDCDESFCQEEVDGHTIRMYSNTQRGLSRSRNLAILHAKGDICLISDDSEKFEDNYVETILSAFKRHPDADIIAFNFKRTNHRSSSKEKFKKEGKASKYTFFSSQSLAFRRDVILNNHIFFDYRLGAGSCFISAGEEGAWQRLARKKGLIIYQCPEVIATVVQEDSTWFTGFHEKYFYDLGANINVKFPEWQYIFMFYYVWRLRKDASIPKWKQIKYMMAGMKGFKQGMSYNDYSKNHNL